MGVAGRGFGTDMGSDLFCLASPHPCSASCSARKLPMPRPRTCGRARARTGTGEEKHRKAKQGRVTGWVPNSNRSPFSNIESSPVACKEFNSSTDVDWNMGVEVPND